MLTEITTVQGIRESQTLLLRQLKESLQRRRGPFYLGHQGEKSKRVPSILADDTFWFHTKRLVDDVNTPRYWNAFGISSRLVPSKGTSIVVEINVPLRGHSKRVAGLFAKDSLGHVFLLHRGRIGGGRPGIGKEAFIDWYQPTLVDVQHKKPNQRLLTTKAIVIAELAGRDVAQNISRFVRAVSDFKRWSQAQEVESLSNAELAAKAKAAKRGQRSSRVQTSVTVRERNPYVAEYVKRQAQGKCDLCRNKAPFNNGAGKPYLECHHVDWLSNDGPDVPENAVALCPNCHRKMHVVRNPKDVETLRTIAAKRSP